MKSRVVRSLMFIIISAALAGSCGGVGERSNPVPAGLSSIEEAAEDAYDQALAGHFADVTTDAQTIVDAWQAFRPEAAAAGAPVEDLTAMDAAVDGLVAAAMDPTDAVVLGRAANAVSGPMDELYGLYDAPVPAEVLALDYLGREVVLDARQGDYDRATAQIDVLAATFETIRAALVAADGGEVATSYDASIAAMRADVMAEDATKLQADTNVGLELVDRMEGVFTKANG
jgi:hypothetical protein